MKNSPPNILLVILDSVRAKNCSTHGHDNETTPFLSRFVRRATKFHQTRSPSIHSVSSHASLFSGYHVEEHGVTEHTARLKPSANLWHELGHEYDYETGIFTPNAVITQASNLGDVFDHYVGPKRKTTPRLYEDAFSPADIEGSVSAPQYLRELLKQDQRLYALLNGLYYKFSSPSGAYDPKRESADVYLDEFHSWLRNRTGPWAACLNLMDAHYPYVPEPEYDQWGGDALAELRERIPDGPMSKTFLEGQPWGQLRALEPLYDGCIRQLDAALETLVSRLKQLGEYENTLLVVTSDHGEGFGERSSLTPDVRLVDHSWGIDEVLTHVPLLVKEPHQSSGRTIDEVATLTNFPNAVRGAIAGEDVADAFVPDDEPVISSTYRIVPPGDELPLDESEREPYFGPWRAVYREEDDHVTKYASRGDDEATFHVRDAQTTYVVEDGGRDVVEPIFEKLTDAGVRVDADSDDVSDDVETRLEDLGYLR